MESPPPVESFDLGLVEALKPRKSRRRGRVQATRYSALLALR